MFGIIADVVSLTQYVLLKDDLNYCRPERCICCGKAGVWFHGCYPRKPDRVPGSNRQLNPVLIQRFFCRSCRHTFSQLPECIAPRRWYCGKYNNLRCYYCWLAVDKSISIQKDGILLLERREVNYFQDSQWGMFTLGCQRYPM